MAIISEPKTDERTGMIVCDVETGKYLALPYNACGKTKYVIHYAKDILQVTDDEGLSTVNQNLR